ncbi:M14 family metallopeptidase [Chondrinema litorale]|uniref:M14 family metallopeptidase n=1 Tax=Chondrinema litorale TaxID=2994555 RepID=UPI0025429545|nr:M14 metallopeptidase family protein [Chondrinema litorale]UZR92267.1 M14 family metallopeptidase [Chondrinema litorale]
MKKLTFLLSIQLIICSMAWGQDDFSKQLFEKYDKYLEKSVAHQYLKREDIAPLIDNLKKNDLFKVSKLGESVEGREISLIECGTGPIKVLLWSQMHGNEPTATMALMDIFNFLAKSDQFDDVRKDILEKTTLYFVPMLNPDGAEKYQRRNALDLDLNRDALRLQSPEANILKDIRDKTDADFGFNLHDQSTLYSAGVSENQASISFLAPAYNWEKDVNESRGNAMKIIAQMNKTLQEYIPGKVGKYDDTFEPRAFGDNIQKWGTSTILIETGGYPNDVEKQFLRKMNFIGILTSLKSIANKEYASESIDNYYSIPDNKRYLYDLVIRNAQVEFYGNLYTMDIGINRSKGHEGDSKETMFRGYIAEFGDMSTFFGYNEFDASGLVATPGKISDDKKVKLKAKQLAKLHKEGVVAIPNEKGIASSYINQPINLYNDEKPEFKVRLGSSANFSLQRNGEVKAVVINGFLYLVEDQKEYNGNGVIMK